MATQQSNESSPKTSKPKNKRLPKPPDGGWGWWVVVASFLIHVVADGVTYTFGVFVKEIIDDLHLDRGVTAWIQSIMTGVTYGVGPIAGAITNKYGCRNVSVAGSILAAFGFAVSYLASNIFVLYFTIGIIGGVGLGLIYLPTIVIVTCYFEKRRAFATGIAVCGSGFGTMIFAPIVNYTIQNFKWRMSLVIVAGLILTNAIFSLFFKPLEEIEEEDEDEEEATATDGGTSNATKPLMNTPENPTFPIKNKFLQIPKDTETATMSTSQPILSTVAKEGEAAAVKLYSKKRHSLKPNLAPPGTVQKRPSVSTSGMILNRKDVFYSGSLMNLKPSGFEDEQPEETKSSESVTDAKENVCTEYMKVINKMIGFSLLKDPVFLLFAISNFLTSFGYTVPYVYLVDHASGEDNMYNDMTSSSYLLSVVGISNTISRVVLGYLCDKPWVNRLYLYNVALAINGIGNTYTDLKACQANFPPWRISLWFSLEALPPPVFVVPRGATDTDRGNPPGDILPGGNRPRGEFAMGKLASTGLCAHTHDYKWLTVFAVVFGSTIGVYVSLTSVITVDLLSLEQLTNAFGLLLLFIGVATVIGPPLVGELFDYTKSYVPGFWLAGGMIAVSGLMLFAIPLVQKKPKNKENNTTSIQLEQVD